MSNVEYQVIFRDKATFEFAEVYKYYNEQREGLGEEFANAVAAKLNRIAKEPHHYKKIYKNFHEALVDKFPFLIIYTLIRHEELIIIAAVFHTSRNPRIK